jgi:hypothetical protein
MVGMLSAMKSRYASVAVRWSTRWKSSRIFPSSILSSTISSFMPSHELTPYFWQIEKSSIRIERSSFSRRARRACLSVSFTDIPRTSAASSNTTAIAQFSPFTLDFSIKAYSARRLSNLLGACPHSHDWTRVCEDRQLTAYHPCPLPPALDADMGDADARGTTTPGATWCGDAAPVSVGRADPD